MAAPATATIGGMLSGADKFTTAFLSETFPALASQVEPWVYYLALLYWGWTVIAMYQGWQAMNLKDIVVKMAFTSLAFWFINWGGGAGWLYGTVTGLMDGIGGTVMGGTNATSLADGFTRLVRAIAEKMMNLAWYEIGFILKGLLLQVVNIILMGVVVIYLTIAKVGVAITMLFFPIFLAFGIFPATRQWLFNWISTMLNFVFTYLLLVAIVRFGFSAFIASLGGMEGLSAIGKMTAKEIDYISIFVYELVIIVLVLHVRGWASALTGGGTGGSGGLIAIIRAAATKGAAK